MGATVQTMTPCDARVNLTDADDETMLQWMYPDTRIQVSIVSRSVILAVGLVSNGAFFVVSARSRSMHTLVNLYLVNLAAADVLVLLHHAAAPIVSYAVLRIPSDGHLLGAAGCMASVFFSYLGYFASIALVCLVSTERYLAVCYPLRHHSINTKGRASKLIACAWLLSALLSACAIPTQAVFTKNCIAWPDGDEEEGERFAGYPSYAGRCVPAARWAARAFGVAQAVPFFSALLCNAVFFARIVRELRDRGGVSHGAGSLRARHRAERVTHQVTKMLVVSGAVFFVCHAPFQIVSLCLLVSAAADLPLFAAPYAQAVVTAAFRLLVYANSAVNPLVYSATNSRYRGAFLRVFACAPRARRRQSGAAASAAPPLAADLPKGHAQRRRDDVGRVTTDAGALSGALANGDSRLSLITKL